MFQILKESRNTQAIPENKTGLISELKVLKAGKIEHIKVNVNIEHDFIGDLRVTLTSPAGKEIVLHDRAGGNNKNLQRAYDHEVVADLKGASCNGIWKLQVQDKSPRDSGILNSWSIDMRCSEKQPTTEIMLPANPKEGLESVQECRFTGRVTGINLLLDLEHPNLEQLKVQLVSPSGKTVTLHNKTGANQKNLKKTYSTDDLKEMVGENTAGKWTLRMNDGSTHLQGQLRHWKITFQYTQIDNLKKVEGIGPKIEQLLNGAGIFSFSRLSVSSAEHLKDILVAAGDRFKMHDPTTWPNQAKMAANGDWEKLSQWQDQLDGGRLN